MDHEDMVQRKERLQQGRAEDTWGANFFLCAPPKKLS